MRGLVFVEANWRALLELGSTIWKRRRLIWELARREIQDRYAGQILGWVWAVGHPLILLGVYLFVFGFIFKARISGVGALPLNYSAYLMAGLIPWLGFQEALAKSASVIVSHANLVKQVVFPVEVLPLKSVVATLITEWVLFAGLLVYLIVQQRSVPIFYALLPVLIALQVLAMIGVVYALAAVGAYFRDLKEFVQVFNVIGIYLLPAIYVPGAVPKAFLPILLCNPFSYMVWCFQDVLYYGRMEHPWAWVVWTMLSLGTFVLGYRLFRRLSVLFGNVL